MKLSESSAIPVPFAPGRLYLPNVPSQLGQAGDKPSGFNPFALLGPLMVVFVTAFPFVAVALADRANRLEPAPIPRLPRLPPVQPYTLPASSRYRSEQSAYRSGPKFMRRSATSKPSPSAKRTSKKKSSRR